MNSFDKLLTNISWLYDKGYPNFTIKEDREKLYEYLLSIGFPHSAIIELSERFIKEEIDDEIEESIRERVLFHVAGIVMNTNCTHEIIDEFNSFSYYLEINHKYPILSIDRPIILMTSCRFC